MHAQLHYIYFISGCVFLIAAVSAFKASALLTLVMTAFVAGGWKMFLLRQRSEQVKKQWWMRNADVLIAVCIGSTFTVVIVTIVYNIEQRYVEWYAASAGAAGFLLTAVLAAIIAFIGRRKVVLEAMIEKGTVELRQSDLRFRNLFEQSPDPHLLFWDNVIVACNDAAAALLNGTRE
jgi:hypothetical protein